MQARSRGLLAVGMAAVAGAAALPITSVGVGWPIAALAVAGVVWATRQNQGSPESQGFTESRAFAEGPGEGRGDRAWRLAAGAAALLLAAVPAARASETLAILCLVSAGLLGSYALAGGSTWRDIAGRSGCLVAWIGPRTWLGGLADVRSNPPRRPDRGRRPGRAGPLGRLRSAAA